MPEPVIPPLHNDPLRAAIRDFYLKPERDVLAALLDTLALEPARRARISDHAADLVRRVRRDSTPTMMENFLAEYGLSTSEGVALMCLAEALLRVPDNYTIDELIEDKISHGNWGEHLGHSDSPLVNASTWALLLTGKIIADEEERGLRRTLQGLVRRLGEPVVRGAVAQAMKELGRHFVLGTHIDNARGRARELEGAGYTYSYDMLGEAARTEDDARRYHLAYSDAITALAQDCKHADIRANPGISIKLSALHPRYEIGQHRRVLDELVPRVASLAQLARSANMGFNIDAEEADRLDISLDVIEALLTDPALAGWDGFGVVVQAFGKRALPVLEWLYALTKRLDRKIMVRLVKGAYWDTEIKRAQVLGLADYPVFTRKVNTDISYLACARRLLQMSDRIYAQFATHNAQSVAAVLELADGNDNFEFQRLHGMGEALHDRVHRERGTRCRIYAPVGEHQDLLAYLVRRLLENGANSSFVNQIVDTSITPESIARDPVDALSELGAAVANPNIPAPAALYGDDRRNSRGWDITDLAALHAVDAERELLRGHRWQAGTPGANPRLVTNPADRDDIVGEVYAADDAQIEQAIAAAAAEFPRWSARPTAARAECLRRAADLYEAHAAEIFALLAREAGKTWLDAVGELREAVDFARYYAQQATRLDDDLGARGTMLCISPWNFPLAIFSGQVFAALAAGNCVIAKPAEQTCLVASLALRLMHEAGIPPAALLLLPGGGDVGARLTADSRLAGVCFTGSTATAQHIHRSMAAAMPADAPLIAETGGLNAMLVDSTALPEQVVRDVLASAFQSAGQRCSALRVLYLQADVADKVLEMLYGAMDELRIGDPWYLATDIGPVIDDEARERIVAHCDRMAAAARVRKTLAVPARGIFVAPTVIELDGIEQLDEEIFGPVLHVVRFEAEQIDAVIDAVNARGYGLTFGMHTRVDSRVEQVVKRVRAGNIYVNRNQIGAVVGTQPFGGEGLSGTGPKAGGPSYLPRFASRANGTGRTAAAPDIDAPALQQVLDASPRMAAGIDTARLRAFADERGVALPIDVSPAIIDMPGPTGENNQLSTHPRGRVLCIGPDRETALAQALAALATQNAVTIVAREGAALGAALAAAGFAAHGADGSIYPAALADVDGFDAVLTNADAETRRAYRLALARRAGVIVPLIAEHDDGERLVLERHLCIDTTAAGGNASLIAAG
ncbi:MAG: bifunctional proline dehydrogenase/L-glutamate gamma-semialdehyde dehydrogenase PutA [Gammaproteobacteria bacterium]|nr:bifunctional proline dehydrogenase/L-glutamate gamma-semialdehyde dehydrogenase PutA [Gammaproteobacteria bacterium]